MHHAPGLTRCSGQTPRLRPTQWAAIRTAPACNGTRHIAISCYLGRAHCHLRDVRQTTATVSLPELLPGNQPQQISTSTIAAATSRRRRRRRGVCVRGGVWSAAGHRPSAIVVRSYRHGRRIDHVAGRRPSALVDARGPSGWLVGRAVHRPRRCATVRPRGPCSTVVRHLPARGAGPTAPLSDRDTLHDPCAAVHTSHNCLPFQAQRTARASPRTTETTSNNAERRVGRRLRRSRRSRCRCSVRRGTSAATRSVGGPTTVGPDTTSYLASLRQLPQWSMCGFKLNPRAASSRLADGGVQCAT